MTLSLTEQLAIATQGFYGAGTGGGGAPISGDYVADLITALDAAASAIIGSAYDTYDSDYQAKMWNVLATAIATVYAPGTTRAWGHLTTDGFSGASIVADAGITSVSIGGSVNEELRLTLDTAGDTNGAVFWAWNDSMGSDAAVYMITPKWNSTTEVALVLRTSAGALSNWNTVATDLNVKVHYS